MKEQIYTIPVIDGFKEGGECPLCNMHKKLDSNAVDYMLGASYMEDDIRMNTNKSGFCKEHYKKMYTKKNRLGLALMVHTHLQQINKDLDSIAKELKPISKKGLFSKNIKNDNQLNSYLNNISNSCYICNTINTTFERYLNTFFYMWKKGNEIKEYVKNSNGFCINHFSLLLTVGEKELNSSEYKEFIDILIPIQLSNLKRLEEEVEWFINKFDYKYNDEPWKTSKDSLQRALNKISSIFVDEG